MSNKEKGADREEWLTLVDLARFDENKQFVKSFRIQVNDTGEIFVSVRWKAAEGFMHQTIKLDEKEATYIAAVLNEIVLRKIRKVMR